MSALGEIIFVMCRGGISEGERGRRPRRRKPSTSRDQEFNYLGVPLYQKQKK